MYIYIYPLVNVQLIKNLRMFWETELETTIQFCPKLSIALQCQDRKLVLKFQVQQILRIKAFFIKKEQ